MTRELRVDKIHMQVNKDRMRLLTQRTWVMKVEGEGGNLLDSSSLQHNKKQGLRQTELPVCHITITCGLNQK